VGRSKVLDLKGKSFLSGRSESDGVSRLSDFDSFSMGSYLNVPESGSLARFR